MLTDPLCANSIPFENAHANKHKLPEVILNQVPFLTIQVYLNQVNPAILRKMKEKSIPSIMTFVLYYLIFHSYLCPNVDQIRSNKYHIFTVAM